MPGELYNLIMHADPESWLGDSGYVDLPKDRFLEHTEGRFKEQFHPLDQNAIENIKKMPTLFAVEHESADTKIGSITDIEVQSRNLRIHYKVSADHYPLPSGVLKKNWKKLDINKDGLEFYRTHWAIKECNIRDFYVGYLKTLTGIAQKLEAADKKVQLIYAFNGTGKTRLSGAMKALIDPKGEDSDEPRQSKFLYYNAFTEDLFYWDNDLNGDVERKLLIRPNNYTSLLLNDLGLQSKVIETYKRYTGSKIEPLFGPENTSITFPRRGEDGKVAENIKISRGEESNLIWSIFFCLLTQALEELSNPSVEDRITDRFNFLEYVFIDDPVSSLDDNHLIQLAVDIATLIREDKSSLRFVITTHNPLFYNVIQNELKRKCDASEYKPRHSKVHFLERFSNGELELKDGEEYRPFAYHLFLLSELKKAINSGNIEKYHFVFLRNILEKTSTFLGHKNWGHLIEEGVDPAEDAFASRIINLSSHSQYASEEVSIMKETDKEALQQLVEKLIAKLNFKVGAEANV